MNNIKSLILTILILTAYQSKAQLNPLASQFYINQYIANPAYAGIRDGLQVNGSYRKLWNNIDGAPVTQNLTADYRSAKVGLGLNMNNEGAGLQNQFRAMATYAYHLPLNDLGSSLHFGVSAGVTTFRLNTQAIIGNPGDVLAGRYNDRKAYLDGDFGAALTTNSLEIQAALPNLKSTFAKDDLPVSDATSFYGAASYRIRLGSGVSEVALQPKAAYRAFRNYKDIVDLGAQVSFADQQVLLSGIYHTSQSATFGIGMNYRKTYLIFASYTTQTSALSAYTNGSFELNLRLNMFNKVQ